MDRAGVETLVMNVYRRLDRTGLQFDFAVVAADESDYDPEILKLGGRLFRHPHPNAALWPYVQRLYGTLRHQGPFAAVHSHVHHFSGAVLLTARLAGVPVRIAHSHTTNDGRAASAQRRAYRSVMRALISRNATHLLANSRASGTALYGEACDSDRRFQVVPNGVGLAEFVDPSPRFTGLRQELGLSSSVSLIGHVGRFSPAKNHEFLVRIFTALAQRLPTAHLVLAGDGPLRSEFEQQLLRLGLRSRVHMLGVRGDVAEVMRSLDVLVFPSLYEGLGNVVIEAQAAGVPCLVSDVVPPETDLGLGLVHFMSLKQAPQAWAGAVMEAMDVHRPPFSARKEAIETSGYTIEHTCRRLLDIYAPEAN